MESESDFLAQLNYCRRLSSMWRVTVPASGSRSMRRSSWKGTRAPEPESSRQMLPEKSRMSAMVYGAGGAAFLVEEAESDEVLEC